jgi:hypothetical protein
MKYLLALLICFCLCNSPNGVAEKKAMDPRAPFTICLTCDPSISFVMIYPFNGTNAVEPLGNLLLQVGNDSCKVLDTLDGLRVIAYYLTASSIAIYPSTKRATFTVHKGDYWNL